MVMYFLIFNLVGFYSITKAIKDRAFILLIFNLLIVSTYGLKLILSCNGYFVVYTACNPDSEMELLIIFLIILPFFLGQHFSITKQSLKVDLSFGRLTIEDQRIPIIYLFGLVLFAWSGSDSFQEMGRAGVEQATGNGVFNLVTSSVTMLILTTARYRSFIYTVITAILALAATGTKQMLFLPIILYFGERFRDYHGKLHFTKVIFGCVAALVTAQIVRSSSNSDINIDFLLFNLAIPFDALDNAVTVIKSAYEHDLAKLLYPSDFKYFAESLMNFIPRSIWSEKPEVMGFWRIQRDYLPELYTSTSGMSVATSLPVDILLSFGLIFGSFILFVFARFISCVDRRQIDLGIAYPLLLVFSVDFSRGGFRSVGMTILIYLTMVFLSKLIGFSKYLVREALNNPRKSES